MVHFTYNDAPDFTVLKQGDVLDKNKIIETLKQVHPHYLKEDYTHFVVLTQSCDLVPRSGSIPSCRYITIAAVRPLNLVIRRELELKAKHAYVEINGSKYWNDKFKVFCEDFLRRLFNNNISNYFFLKSEPKYNFNDDSCCFLNLSIALKTKLHYEELLSAKIAELDDVFQSKLGWLVGNLYSRVGTPDWVPTALNEADFKRLISETVDSAEFWVGQGFFSYVKKVAPQHPDLDYDEIFLIASSEKQKSKVNKIQQIVTDFTKQLKLDDSQRARLDDLLSGEPVILKKYFKDL